MLERLPPSSLDAAQLRCRPLLLRTRLQRVTRGGGQKWCGSAMHPIVVPRAPERRQRVAALAAGHVHDAVLLVAGRNHHALGGAKGRALHARHVAVARQLIGRHAEPALGQGGQCTRDGVADGGGVALAPGVLAARFALCVFSNQV